jgi:DNA-binding CsgD family transcriptional regulator
MKTGINKILRRYYFQYKDYPLLFRQFVFGYSTKNLSDIVCFTYSSYNVESQILAIDFEELISDLYLYYLRAQNRVGPYAVNYLVKVLTTKAMTLCEKRIRKYTITMNDITEELEHTISHNSYQDCKHKETEQAERELKMQAIQFRLTETEISILRYLVDGLSFFDICDKMDMKPTTFKTLKSRIQTKLEMTYCEIEDPEIVFD